MNNCQFTVWTLQNGIGILKCLSSGKFSSSPILSQCVLVVVLGAAFALLLAGRVQAQEPEFTLNVNVDLVELRVAVRDESDRNVSGLEAVSFQVFEDSVQQDVTLV